MIRRRVEGGWAIHLFIPAAIIYLIPFTEVFHSFDRTAETREYEDRATFGNRLFQASTKEGCLQKCQKQ